MILHSVTKALNRCGMVAFPQALLAICDSHLERKELPNAFPPWNFTVAPSVASSFGPKCSYACQVCIPALELAVAPGVVPSFGGHVSPSNLPLAPALPPALP